MNILYKSKKLIGNIIEANLTKGPTCSRDRNDKINSNDKLKEEFQKKHRTNNRESQTK